MNLQNILIDWSFLNPGQSQSMPSLPVASFRLFLEKLDQTFHESKPLILVLLPQDPISIPRWHELEAILKSLKLKSIPQFVANRDIKSARYTISGATLMVKAPYCDVFFLKGVVELGIANSYKIEVDSAASFSGIALSSGEYKHRVNLSTTEIDVHHPSSGSNIFYLDINQEASLYEVLDRFKNGLVNDTLKEDTIIHPYGREWPPLVFPTIDSSWTLFLDRDGVINHRIVGDYVKTPAEFDFIPGVPEAISRFRQVFGKIVVVTNQQGIGKGLMSTADLESVHQKMQIGVAASGGQIDKIYHCPDLAANRPVCRKPLPGMAIKAIADFPEIDPSKSIMVGDSLSDIEFGRRLGMFTVKIGETCQIEHLRIDRLLDLVPFI